MRMALSFQGTSKAKARALCLGNLALFHLLLGLFLVPVAGCDSKPHVVVHGRSGAVRIPVEIAATHAARSRGLMYRKDLAADAGMLFLFPKEEEQNFWMKNTPLPLDMVFIGGDLRITGIVERTTPFSTEPRGVGKPSRYVLEVHAGFCERHGIRAADRVELVNVTSTPTE